MILSNSSALPPPVVPACPTLWGLGPMELHDRFWAARGVQVVRQGQSTELAAAAQTFLLMEPQTLAILDPAGVEQVVQAAGKDLVYVRVHDVRPTGRRERVVADAQGRFVRFERLYDRPHWRLARAAFTTARSVALRWQRTTQTGEGWRTLRRTIHRPRRSAVPCRGMLFDGSDSSELAAFVKALTQFWRRPDLTIACARAFGGGIWQDRQTTINPAAKLIGPIWIGAGRSADAGTTVIGPAVLWDDPAAHPDPGPIPWHRAPFPQAWEDTSPAEAPDAQPRTKRVFDILFSLFALAVTLPLYIPITLAILADDGWPIFFVHRRETIGGHEFPCIKFRSMRKDALQLRSSIEALNQCDGPQFHIPDDPRLTRSGRWLRRFRMDELPQFLNVLAGQMSVVGPRPSPFSENQFCPAWREARLSVRPGITGLWQVQRTRDRGADFQEWIKYDLEYVERHRWRLDLLIIWKTVLSLLRSDARS